MRKRNDSGRTSSFKAVYCFGVSTKSGSHFTVARRTLHRSLGGIPLLSPMPVKSLLLPLVLAAAFPGITYPAPLALHPENPHYFLFREKAAVLITSGEHYGAVLNLDFDYVKYLDTLAADGLNLTRTFSGAY